MQNEIKCIYEKIIRIRQELDSLVSLVQAFEITAEPEQKTDATPTQEDAVIPAINVRRFRQVTKATGLFRSCPLF